MLWHMLRTPSHTTFMDTKTRNRERGTFINKTHTEKSKARIWWYLSHQLANWQAHKQTRRIHEQRQGGCAETEPLNQCHAQNETHRDMCTNAECALGHTHKQSREQMKSCRDGVGGGLNLYTCRPCEDCEHVRAIEKHVVYWWALGDQEAGYRLTSNRGWLPQYGLEGLTSELETRGVKLGRSLTSSRVGYAPTTPLQGQTARTLPPNSQYLFLFISLKICLSISLYHSHVSVLASFVLCLSQSSSACLLHLTLPFMWKSTLSNMACFGTSGGGPT